MEYMQFRKITALDLWSNLIVDKWTKNLINWKQFRNTINLDLQRKNIFDNWRFYLIYTQIKCIATLDIWVKNTCDYGIKQYFDFKQFSKISNIDQKNNTLSIFILMHCIELKKFIKTKNLHIW